MAIKKREIRSRPLLSSTYTNVANRAAINEDEVSQMEDDSSTREHVVTK